MKIKYNFKEVIIILFFIKLWILLFKNIILLLFIIKKRILYWFFNFAFNQLIKNIQFNLNKQKNWEEKIEKLGKKKWWLFK